MLTLWLFAAVVVHQNGVISGSNNEPNMLPNRTTMVHLFEWRWDDITRECEEFLGPYGYGAVQVSPANENGIVWEPFWNRDVKRPWFERYQPVSYKIATRSGDEPSFRDMVRRCNNAGVRIYVDCVINHMTGDIGKGHGTGGSYFDPSIPSYEGVPYGPSDFNDKSKCPTESGNIENYNDVNQVRNCRLQGLADLDLGKEYVRGKIAAYLNHLIDIGVAGFRIDAAKHMWPNDLSVIYGRLHNLNSAFFSPGTRPFIFQEVIDMGGEPIKAEQYVQFGRVTEFRFGKELGDVIRKNYNQKLQYLKNFGEGWGFVPGYNAVVFLDNHDNQRGHGAGGFGSVLTHMESRMYKMGTAFMLAWPYGTPRVMSSYRWPRQIQGGKDLNDWIGPPTDENYNIKPVVRNADLTCGNGWVCEHRWRQIYNMMKFRNVAGVSEAKHWWDNGHQQIAFARQGRGFLAINNDDFPLNQRLQTTLPQGKYCDIISGNKEGGRCTGKTVDVDASGYAQINVDNTWEDPIIAVHLETKHDDGSQTLVGKDLGEQSPAPLPSAPSRPIVKQNELLSLACQYLEKSEEYQDNGPTIAMVWGEKLIALDPQQRLFAEKAINDVLFEASLGNLHRYSVRINEDPYYQRLPSDQSFPSTSGDVSNPSVPSPAEGMQAQEHFSHDGNPLVTLFTNFTGV